VGDQCANADDGVVDMLGKFVADQLADLLAHSGHSIRADDVRFWG
jgi:hypothetical protein